MPGMLRALLIAVCLLEETATDAEHGASWRVLAMARTLLMTTWALCRSRRSCADILRARSETCLMPKWSRVFSLRHRLQTRLRRQQASGRLLRLSRSQQRMLLWRLWNRAMRKLQRALRKQCLHRQLTMVLVRAASESTTQQFSDSCAGIRRCMAMTRIRSCMPSATSRGDRRRRPNMHPSCQGRAVEVSRRAVRTQWRPLLKPSKRQRERGRRALLVVGLGRRLLLSRCLQHRDRSSRRFQLLAQSRTSARSRMWRRDTRFARGVAGGLLLKEGVVARQIRQQEQALGFQEKPLMWGTLAYPCHRRFRFEASKHVRWITTAVGAELLVHRAKSGALPVSRHPTLDMPVVLSRHVRMLVNTKDLCSLCATSSLCMAAAAAAAPASSDAASALLLE